MWKRLALLGLLSMAAGLPVRAWDDTGHMVVAYIAWQHMTPEARVTVSEILQSAPPLSDLRDLRPSAAETSDLIHFMRAAYWPDIVRDQQVEARFERYHHGPWHYTNLFWEEAADGGVQVRDDLQPADENIVERLYHFEELARHDLVATAQKAVLIAWLAHLVGDIHQPLHASARVTVEEPEGDRGGNLFSLGGEDNLHWYWDRALTEAFERQVGESEPAYVQRVAESIMEAHEPPANFEFDYDSWAERSFRIASTDVYAEIERGQQPPLAYAEMTHTTAAESVALAGYRLAALMNSIFS